MILPSTPRSPKVPLIFLSFSAHLILLDLVILKVGKMQKLWRCSFLHPAVTSSWLGPDVPLSTLFWDALNLCLVGARHQVSHQYGRTDNIKIQWDLRFWRLRVWRGCPLGCCTV
jgi:hypothetical protein